MADKFTWNLGESLSNFWDDFTSGIKGVGNWVGDTFFGGSAGTNEANIAMNDENIAFQKAENEITRQREDNAVQRAAQDMTAAGLSKTLAAGHPASAQALTAPSNSNQMQRNVAGMNMLNMVREFHFQNEENERANKLNQAQVDLIKAQAKGQNLNNDTFLENFANEQSLKTSQAFLFGQQANYYTALGKVEEIVGKNKQREIDAQIDKLVQDKIESMTRANLNSINFNKVSYEIASEIIKQEGYKIDNEKKREEFNLLVEQISNAKLEGQMMLHNLDIAKLYGYPTGQYPSSLFGVLERKGKEGAIYDNHKANFALGQYANFAHGYKNAMDELDDFYDDTYAGGGFLEGLRKLFNFNPLNWLFNK